MTFKSNSRLSETACVHGTIENAHTHIPLLLTFIFST